MDITAIDDNPMLKLSQPELLHMSKAKAAKVVRDLVDACLNDDQDGNLKVAMLKESIKWATSQNRVFLRLMLEARLVRLFNDLKRYTDARSQATPLVRELKKMDNKELAIDVHLQESRALYFLSSLAKSRVSLTAARTTASAMFVTPRVQAELDMQAGLLHAADERDFLTAFSYFYEAFEGFDSADHAADATLALKYACLCKVMLNASDDIKGLLASRNALKYAGEDVSAICAVAKAAKNRSLHEFTQALEKYRVELQEDAVIASHFNALKNTMLEKELCRRVEPYSCVEIAHIAAAVALPVDQVEKKLAQMILDKKVVGSLHQGDGVLIVYDATPESTTYNSSAETIRATGEVVDVLYARAQIDC